MNPLVSVIMPVHNCEKYIVDSINSILNQTYENLELIIVDTGSEDRTYDLINEIKDKRINIIRTASDNGLTHAFFQGFKASTGDFITRQDPDDTSSENRLKIQVSYLLKNKDVGMVSCLIKCITNLEKYRRPCSFIEKLQNHYLDSESIEKAIIEDFIPVIFPTLLIRRELIDKAGIKEEPEGFDDQVDLFIQLIKYSKVEKINKILYSYRRHDQAYHLVNQNQHYKYTKELIAASDIKSSLKYRGFLLEKPMNVINLNNKASLRILMLVDALNIGGTETHVLNLAKKLMEQGIYVIVGTSGGPLNSLFESNGIKIYKVPLNTDYISNKNLYSCIKSVKDIVDKEKIDLIHAHLFASMSISNELNKRYKIPYVTTIHGLFYPNDILFASCYNADALLAVSKPTARMIYTKLGDQIKDRLYVIPNGVDINDHINVMNEINIRKDLNIDSNDIVITYCSRLAWQKTLAAESFMFGFFKLSSNNEKLHAIVIGDGDGRSILEREASMLNKCLGRTAIHIVGPKNNVLDYYLISDIVVGTGRVALEAMSCSKPIIAVGNDGYVGIVNNERKAIQWKNYFGDHGSLTKPDLLSIYDDMKYLVENTDERIEIGKWSREWCSEMFNIENITKRTLSIYRRVLDNKKEMESTP